MTGYSKTPPPLQKHPLRHKFMKLSPKVKDGPLLSGRTIRFKKKDGSMGERQLKVDDLTLKVNPQKGNIIEKDISCDSSFKMNHIKQIGVSIHSAYSFVDMDHPIYLFVDNAGGHGKVKVKKQYKKILKDKFNIQIEWQVPNSPKTNMLDLGVWVSLQSLVEKIHRRRVMQSDVLSDSVHEAFKEITSEVLSKVHLRWKLVLQLLVSGRGTNEVVEEHRSLKKKAMLKDLPTVPGSKEARGYVSSDQGKESDAEDDDGSVVGEVTPDALERAFDAM